MWFFAEIAKRVLPTSVVGYLICSVLSRTFSLQYLLQNTKMNTLLLQFELNLALTLICKALKLKEHLPMLAFYRALCY